MEMHNKQKVSYDVLAHIISTGECRDYIFGIHGISISNYTEYVLKNNQRDFNLPFVNYNGDFCEHDLYDNMLKVGLNVPYGSAKRTVLDRGIGRKIQASKLKYHYLGSKIHFNVLIAIPPYIQVGDQKYYCGDFSLESNKGCETYLSRFVLRKFIPKEFIYGCYYIDNISGEVIFERNCNHISMMSDEDKKAFFKCLVGGTITDINILKMIDSETINPNYEGIINYGIDKNGYSLIDYIGSTINSKRLYENPILVEDINSRIDEDDWEAPEIRSVTLRKILRRKKK